MSIPPRQPDSETPASSAERGDLTATFYGELRSIAARQMASERPGHTLQPTAVANEACLRLTRRGLPPLPREQQLAIAARVLEQVLVDHARRRSAAKRGHGAVRLALDADVLAAEPAEIDVEPVHRALERLRDLHPRQAEVVTLRIFAGLTMEQIAGVLGVGKRTVEADWTVARAWMRRALSAEETA